jgi:hypothetical protein
MRTEIPMPIPICAADVVDSDNTETDAITTPNSNHRRERFILINLSGFLVCSSFRKKSVAILARNR